MKIEISDDYIKWASNFCREVGEQPLNVSEVTEYINEVLAQHRASWEEIDEQEFLD